MAGYCTYRDNKGIPSDVEARVNIARQMVEEAADDITPDRIHIDPLVMALSQITNP